MLPSPWRPSQTLLPWCNPITPAPPQPLPPLGSLLDYVCTFLAQYHSDSVVIKQSSCNKTSSNLCITPLCRQLWESILSSPQEVIGKREIRKPLKPDRDRQPFFHSILWKMYGKWKEEFHIGVKVPPVTYLAVLSSLFVTERTFLGWGLHCGSPIDLLPKPSL